MNRRTMLRTGLMVTTAAIVLPRDQWVRRFFPVGIQLTRVRFATNADSLARAIATARGGDYIACVDHNYPIPMRPKYADVFPVPSDAVCVMHHDRNGLGGGWRLSLQEARSAETFEHPLWLQWERGLRRLGGWGDSPVEMAL